MDHEIVHPASPRAIWVSMVKARMPSRSLRHAIMVLETDKRGQAEKCPPRISAIFGELASAFAGVGPSPEELLFKMNVPPAEKEAINDRRAGWAELSADIFSLDPILSNGFVTRLLNQCVAASTHWAFCLGHSEVISVLVANNIPSVDFGSCMRVPHDCQDSRALYSLAGLRWCPMWESTSKLVFHFLFSKSAPIRNSAYWVLRARATMEDVQRLCIQTGTVFPSGVTENADVRHALDAIRKCRQGAAQ